MNKIFVNQVGFMPDSKKKAVLNFKAEEFQVIDANEESVLWH